MILIEILCIVMFCELNWHLKQVYQLSHLPFILWTTKQHLLCNGEKERGGICGPNQPRLTTLLLYKYCMVSKCCHPRTGSVLEDHQVRIKGKALKHECSHYDYGLVSWNIVSFSFFLFRYYSLFCCPKMLAKVRVAGVVFSDPPYKLNETHGHVTRQSKKSFIKSENWTGCICHKPL